MSEVKAICSVCGRDAGYCVPHWTYPEVHVESVLMSKTEINGVMVDSITMEQNKEDENTRFVINIKDKHQALIFAEKFYTYGLSVRCYMKNNQIHIEVR